MVVTGDLPDSIAANCSVSLTALLAINPNINEAKALIPGQVIRIPPWPITCTLGNYSKPSTAPALAIASAPTAALQTLSIQFSVSGVRELDAWEGLEGPARAVVLQYKTPPASGLLLLQVWTRRSSTHLQADLPRPLRAPELCRPGGLPPSQVQVAQTVEVSGALRRRLQLLGEGGVGGSHGRSLNQATPSVVESQLAAPPQGPWQRSTRRQRPGTLGIVLSAMGLTLVPGSLRVVSAGTALLRRRLPPRRLRLGRFRASPPPHLWAACLPPAHSLPLVRPALGNSHLPAILGGAIGGGVALLVVLSVVVVLVLWHRRAATRENVTRDSTLRSKDFVP